MNDNLTDEQKKDIQQRTELFYKEYQKLTEKYQIDFLLFPDLAPNDKGVFGIRVQSILQDKKYLK